MVGIAGFFKTISLLLMIMELSLLIEEFIDARLEFRKGFSGAKTNILKVLQRHLLKLLRLDLSFKQNLTVLIACLVSLMAAGLLPTWAGAEGIDWPHSLWIFLGVMAVLPTFMLIFEWRMRRGKGWPSLLMSAERAIGSTTIVLILGATLVEMSGADSFGELKQLQLSHTWLIFYYPMSILLLFAFLVTTQYMLSEEVFSYYISGEDQARWGLDDFLPLLQRTVWSLFFADGFLGGSAGTSMFSDVFLVVKCVVLIVGARLVSQLFMRLREDQAESFILWRLAPLSVVILALSLLLSGGRL